MNNTSGDDILLRNCRTELPLGLCIFANICGLASTSVWFFVLLPQLVLNFRRRSVEGLSPWWAVANFTASLNNTFFVFKFPSLPLYAKISAIYMPILEALMLVQFLIFTPFSKQKAIVIVACSVVWICIICLQTFLTIYEYMEWISITLWSIETFPQIFLNFKRHSTLGLSLGMVSLTTFGKLSDFFGTYLLQMPIQYVVMCYFSSSTALIVTMQVCFFETIDRKKGQSLTDEDSTICDPLLDDDVEEIVHDIPIIERSGNEARGKICRKIGYPLIGLLLICEIMFVGGLFYRTEFLFFKFAPLVVFFACFSAYCLYKQRKISFD